VGVVITAPVPVSDALHQRLHASEHILLRRLSRIHGIERKQLRSFGLHNSTPSIILATLVMQGNHHSGTRHTLG
jgi:hypothetical protein